MKISSFKKLAYTSLAALALIGTAAIITNPTSNVEASTSASSIPAISSDTLILANGYKFVTTYTDGSDQGSSDGVHYYSYNVKHQMYNAAGQKIELPQTQWVAYYDDRQFNYSDDQSVDSQKPKWQDNLEWLPYGDFAPVSYDGKTVEASALYKSHVTKTIKTANGSLSYDYYVLNVKLNTNIVESTYTDKSTGKQQHGVKFYVDSADDAIKDGTAFCVNPYGTSKTTVVKNPATDIPLGDYSETFELGTGTLVGFFTKAYETDGGGDGIYYSYYTDNATGLTVDELNGVVNQGGVENYSDYIVNPTDPQYGGIKSVTRSEIKSTGPDQGQPEKADKYVTLSSKNYTIWDSFDFDNVKHYSKNYYQKTYHVKNIYYHLNGSVYYSLYDNKGKWFGYINANGTKMGSGQQGGAISANKYVTLTSKNYKIWYGFDFKKVKHYSKNYYQKTYHVKTVYNSFSSTTYLSLYDSKGKWFGYINQFGTKTASGQQGIAITYKETVTIKKSGYTIWGSFFGKKRGTTTKYKGKKLTAKVKYNCANGSTYLSLYSGSKWIGYVNDGVAK